MRFGLDYAWTTISPAAHRAIGSTFACRYLSTDPAKNLSLGEVRQLEQGGIDIVAVWETTATRALDGHAAGACDATAALHLAETLGIPVHRPIYFAVDFDETPGQAGAVLDYFNGVASVLGVALAGAYGGYWVIKRLFDAGAIGYGWQTYAWSGGQLDPRAQLYQFSNAHVVAGQSCDYNHALAADFGQWSYEPPVPPPLPPYPPGVDPMSVAITATPDGNLVALAQADASPGEMGEVFVLWTTRPGGDPDTGPVWHGKPGVTPHLWVSLGTPGT